MYRSHKSIFFYLFSFFDGPVLCNVKIKKGEQIIPKLVFGKTLENLAPFVSEETLKKDLDFSC